jgi:sigma-B regulation protein RsbU (phosphoserine phosphatase)
MTKKYTYEELGWKFNELENEVIECKTSEKSLRENLAKLRKERDFYQEAISAVCQPIYAIDVKNYKILMANSAAINLFGDHIDNPFCYSWTHGRATPCSGGEHVCPLEIIKNKKKPITVEHTHYDKKGRPLFFKIHAYPLFDAEGNVTKIIEYSEEITKIKRMEYAQRESEERYREIIENAHDIIQSISPDGSLAYVNRAWFEILGYSELNLRSINFFDIIHPDSLQHCQELFSRIMEGKSGTHIPLSFVSKDGEQIFAEGNISPRILEGNVIAAHCIFRDITESKKADEALKENEKKLHRYSKHLEQIIASLNVAKEVQQSLLPKRQPKVKRLDIAGCSLYCDETGGDYYDYIKLPHMGSDVYGIIIGDVSGHGVSAALQMASVRAYLHGRVAQVGTVAEIITDVNRLVSTDVMETAVFMTLFFLKIEACTGRLSWVRAGHDPALIYCPDLNHFEKLEGKGLPLGVDKSYQYRAHTAVVKPEQLLILTTDGILESRNIKGEFFGRERLKESIRRNADLGAEGIKLAIIDAVRNFRGEAKQDDDITLVILKFL